MWVHGVPPPSSVLDLSFVLFIFLDFLIILFDFIDLLVDVHDLGDVLEAQKRASGPWRVRSRVCVPGTLYDPSAREKGAAQGGSGEETRASQSP